MLDTGRIVEERTSEETQRGEGKLTRMMGRQVADGRQIW
jgi:hypothetical protein